MRSPWLPPRTDSPVATWILSGIDAMGVKRSLSHRQKGVQVYDTQIMICDKRQCSWPRGLATSPYHKRPFFALIEPVEGGRDSAAAGGPLGMVALARSIVTPCVPCMHRCMGSRIPCCAPTAFAASHVRGGW